MDNTSKKPVSSFVLIARLWREFLRPRANIIFLAFFFMVLYAVCEALNLKLLEPVFDRVFIARDKSMLWPLAAMVLATFVFKSIADYCQARLMGQTGYRVVADLRSALFNHLMTLDVPFFSRQATGTLVSRFTVDTATLSGAISNALTRVGKDIFSVIFLVALMFHQDALLASIIFFVVPFAAIPVDRLGKRMRKRSKNTQEQMGLLNAKLEEVFSGLFTVQINQREDDEKEQLGIRIMAAFEEAYQAARTKAMALPFLDFMGGIAVGIVIVYGGMRVISGELTPGSFFSFIGALITAARPMQALANLHVSLQEGLAGAERLFEVLDAKPQITDKPDAKELIVREGRIVFDEVGFSHTGADFAAISDFSLTIEPGQTVAFVGPSGAGKTTLLALLLRLFETSRGTIKIDGQDIRNTLLHSLYQQTAYVGQNVVLFNDTLAANIAYGNPGADTAAIEKAACEAGVTEFVANNEQGLQALAGERGLSLSGGQRQRISIARALLKDAPILVLDEATSALDTKTEKQVGAAIEKLAQDKTTLIVAHRLSGIRGADKIVVMDNGKIVQSGTHSALLAQKGLYAKLYNNDGNETNA